MVIAKVRLALWAVVLLAVVGFGGAAVYRSLATVADGGEAGSGTALVGGPFELVDGNGELITDADFRGAPFAIFFGFTHCPDICPTSLYEMAGWIDALGADASAMRFAFVTVDPERDTPEIMRDYVGSFSDDIVPMTGSTAQIDAMMKTYRVYARKIPIDDDFYTMDHSSFVYLMDADGAYAAHINYGEPEEQAVGKIRALLARSS